MLSLPELAFFMTVLIIPNGFHKTIRRGFEYSCRFLKSHRKHKTHPEHFDDSCRHSLTDRILILHVAHAKFFTKAPYWSPWVPHRDIKHGKPYPLTRPRPAPFYLSLPPAGPVDVFLTAGHQETHSWWFLGLSWQFLAVGKKSWSGRYLHIINCIGHIDK